MGTIATIREMRRIERMRLGQDAPNIENLISIPEARVAMVPLTEGQFQHALAAAANMETEGNGYGIQLRDRTLQAHMLMYSLREVDDPTVRLFKTMDELLDEDNGIEFVDINHLAERYEMMVADISPQLQLLNEEDLSELKKALGRIDWNVLSGKQQWHLTQVFSTLTVDQLQARSRSRSSTPKSTIKRGGRGSTRTA